jgi:hypothetical protein
MDAEAPRANVHVHIHFHVWTSKSEYMITLQRIGLGHFTLPSKQGTCVLSPMILSDSYTMEMLAKRMYTKNLVYDIFQKNRNLTSTCQQFDQVLDELRSINPEERITMVFIVTTVRNKPYYIIYIEDPSICYHHNTF